MEVEETTTEWMKHPLMTVGEPEPMDLVSVRIEAEGMEVDVSISVPKDTWEIRHLAERASRAAHEALVPHVASHE